MSNIDQWVDQVYVELEDLFARDKNYGKYMLGNYPMKRIFDVYSDWLSVNSTLSPRVAANTVYKDIQGVGYYDFNRRKIKKGIQVHGMPSFNVVYGTQKEIDEANRLLGQLKNQDAKRYDLIMFALEKIKDVSDTVKPAKNIYGKTTNLAKQEAVKMPRLGTLLTFLKMNDLQIRSYIAKFHKTVQPKTTAPAPWKEEPTQPATSRAAWKQPIPTQPATQPIPQATQQNT